MGRWYWVMVLTCMFIIVGVGQSPSFGQRTNDDLHHQHTNDQQSDCPKDNTPADNHVGFFINYAWPRDSIAQWIMAAFSIFSFIASVWAVVVLKTTLRETRNIGEQQVRAYISASKAIVSPTDQRNESPKISIHFQNSGTTPAVNVSYFCKPHVGGRDETSTIKSIGWIERENFIPNIASGATSEINAVITNMNERMREFRRAEESGIPAMLINGVVFYDDVFGKTYMSRFCFIFSDPDQEGELHPIQAPIPQFQHITSRTKYV